MSDIIKTLFGGSDSSSQKAQVRANTETQQFIEQQALIARGDALALFPQAQASRAAGFESALDIFRQTIPSQIDVFQQGNVGAQQALIAGMPQFQNAILGLPTDMSAFQPQRLNVDTSFTQQPVAPPQQQQPVAPATAPPATAPPATAPPGGHIPGQGRISDGGQLPGGGIPAGPRTGGYVNSSGSSITGPGGGGGRGGRDYGGSTFGSGYGSGYGASGSGNSYTYRPTDLQRLGGEQSIGSLNQLRLAENAGLIGRAAGALTGIPGLGTLGSYLGDRFIDNTVFMGPVDPNNPWDVPITTPELAALFPGQEELPNSPLLPSSGGLQSAGSGLAGSLASGVLWQRNPNLQFQFDMAQVGGQPTRDPVTRRRQN